MSATAAPNVFVSYGYSDPVGQDIIDELSRRFTVMTALSVTGEVSPIQALQEALNRADIAVAVLPPPGNRDRSNVIFEAGVAVGMNLPVVVTSENPRLPRAMKGLSTVKSRSTKNLPSFVEDVLRRGVRANYSRQIPSSRAEANYHIRRPINIPHIEAAPMAVNAAEDRATPMRTDELVAYLREVFASAGAEVVVPSHSEATSNVFVPDLVVWSDDLLPVFGAPMVIEVLRRATSSTKARRRLLNLLQHTGARSLLAVAAEGEGNRVWSDGQYIILTLTVKSLFEELSRQELAPALATLLEDAQP